MNKFKKEFQTKPMSKSFVKKIIKLNKILDSVAGETVKKQPYIKPTRFKHDSGFRCFEVGYILEMSDKNKVLKKEVLGRGTDHIYQDYMMMIGNVKPFRLNIDLTMDGYIRFFVHDRELVWGSPFGSSSMSLKVADRL